MKKLTLILLFAITLTRAFNQSLEITEAERNSINGIYKSYLFELPEVEAKQAEEDWKKWMENFNAKPKFDRKNGIWYAENVNIPQLTNAPLNVFASIVGEEKPVKRTSVIVWFALGENQSLPASDSLRTKEDSFKSAYARDLLNTYALNAHRSQAEATLKAEEMLFGEYNKDLKNLQKDKDDFAKSIEKAQSTIAKNEENIRSNETEQTNILDEIDDQKARVETAKLKAESSESDASQKEAKSALKTEEKRLSSLENDLKKLQKNQEDYLEVIHEAKNDIALYEMKLDINQRDQDNKVKIIEAHKEIIELAKENIKKYSN